jgi:hypothetical protein
MKTILLMQGPHRAHRAVLDRTMVVLVCRVYARGQLSVFCTKLIGPVLRRSVGKRVVLHSMLVYVCAKEFTRSRSECVICGRSLHHILNLRPLDSWQSV